jgi:hypothetical protein
MWWISRCVERGVEVIETREQIDSEHFEWLKISAPPQASILSPLCFSSFIASVILNTELEMSYIGKLRRKLE